MKTSTQVFIPVYGLIWSLILLGCGGGSTTSTTAPNVANYKVTGTVPGTLIEALCKDGRYYEVNSTNDGTANHPFTMVLPSGVDCKFIMTTNEKDPDPRNRIITPILFNDGTTISTYFQLTKDMSIGNVPLSLTGAGVQSPLTVVISTGDAQVNQFTLDPLDKNNNNVPDLYEDDDNDGLINIYDDDDDNDGIKDVDDSDYSTDRDGDGIENTYDDDDDNDGIKDDDDDDDDNDGIKDNDDDDYDDDDNNLATTTTPILPTSFKENAGRLLGSQCAQCHGTNGISVNSWDSIARENDLADEIFDDEAIMNIEAHGYTAEEIQLIGNWLITL